jgi:alpha-1,3-rhamnosyltransferase
MSDQALVSVVVAAHNHERFIEAALNSLVAQTHAQLELIVLDDGSTDATWPTIRRLRPWLERRFVRVEIGTKEHEGSSHTIERCLAQARSDLVYLLDSDDVAHPDAIERLLPLLASAEFALAVGDNSYIDASGAATTVDLNGVRHATLLSLQTYWRSDLRLERDFGSYASLVVGNYVPNGWLLRRSCVAAVGGFSRDLILDDWPLLLRLAKRYRMAYAGSVLAKYRIHETNTIRVQEDRILLDTLRVLLGERGYCREQGLEREWWAHVHRIVADLGDERTGGLVRAAASQESWPQELWWFEDLLSLVKTSSARDRATRRVGDLEQGLILMETALAQERAERSTERVHLVSRLEEVEANYQARLQEAAARHAAVLAEQQGLETRLQAVEAAHAGALARLEDLGQRLNAASDALHHARAAQAAAVQRIAAIEASISWRGTAPIRRVADLLSGSGSRRPWRFLLDPPANDESSLGGLILSGWVLHRGSPVERVEVAVGNRPPTPIEFGLERTDVANLPVGSSARCGFRTCLYVVEDRFVLRVACVCVDGTRHAFEWRVEKPAALRARARAIYGTPDPFDASPLGLVRDLLRWGGLGRYIWRSRTIRGWTRGEGEAAALASASDALSGSPVIVEIGSFLGCSAVLLAGPRKRKGTGHLHCVDPFTMIGDPLARPVYAAIREFLGRPVRECLEQNLRRAGLSAWVTIHEMTGTEAAARWREPIDMLYLDADVPRDGASEIFLSWSRFVRPGGTLAINGTAERPYSSGRDGSYRVAQDLVRAPDWVDVRRVDFITFARKAPVGATEQR